MAVNEYAKFLYLHKSYPEGKIVPGKVVDKVWHDHILHTRDYIKFCQDNFGDYLHHDPKNLESSEVNDLTYTLNLYSKSFGYKAPSVFWLEEPCKQHKTSHQSTPTVKVTASTTASCCRCG